MEASARALHELHGDDLKIVFIGPCIAKKGEAAGTQGKFWEFHDLLFKNYNQLNDQKIQDIALTLDLDKTEFEKTMKDPRIQGRVRQDLLDGRQAGVRSIPAVFINGRVLKSRNLQGFQEAIDKELDRLGKKAVKPRLCN